MDKKLDVSSIPWPDNIHPGIPLLPPKLGLLSRSARLRLEDSTISDGIIAHVLVTWITPDAIHYSRAEYATKNGLVELHAPGNSVNVSDVSGVCYSLVESEIDALVEKLGETTPHDNSICFMYPTPGIMKYVDIPELLPHVDTCENHLGIGGRYA